jgi:hypothetical protein
MICAPALLAAARYALLLSVKTLHEHGSNLMRKLMLHNIAEVTLFAIRPGIIDQFCSGAVARKPQSVATSKGAPPCYGPCTM